MSIFDRAMAVGQRQLRRLCARSIVYARKATGSTIDMTGRSSLARVVDRDGEAIVVSVENVNWIVAADDLIDGGTTFRPDHGDTIQVLGNDATETYLVGTPSGELSCWEPADGAVRDLIIHTKAWSES